MNRTAGNLQVPPPVPEEVPRAGISGKKADFLLYCQRLLQEIASSRRSADKNLLKKSGDINNDALLGSPPLPGHPPNAIMPYFFYTIVEKFSVQILPGYRLRHESPTGLVWRKEGGYLKKTGFHMKIEFFQTKQWGLRPPYPRLGYLPPPPTGRPRGGSVTDLL